MPLFCLARSCEVNDPEFSAAEWDHCYKCETKKAAKLKVLKTLNFTKIVTPDRWLKMSWEFSPEKLNMWNDDAKKVCAIQIKISIKHKFPQTF